MGSDLAHIADALLAGGVVQILVGLAILRFALGLTDLVVGVAVAIVALAISLAGTPSIPSAGLPNIEQTLSQRLENISDSKRGRDSLNQNISKAQLAPRELRAQVAVADLKRGVTWGVKLLIPFLLIDLLVAHCFALLQWDSLPAHSVTTPLKLIVFLTIGGWAQIATWLAAAAGPFGGST